MMKHALQTRASGDKFYSLLSSHFSPLCPVLYAVKYFNRKARQVFAGNPERRRHS